MPDPEELQCRVHGDASLPTLVYLPGIHADWTLMGGVRKALAGKVRVVEFTYPRTLAWSLEDYAGAVLAALRENRITEGWLLGESFSSQVVWVLLRAPSHFETQGIILAGGFARYPVMPAVSFLHATWSVLPSLQLRLILLLYRASAWFRYRNSPETMMGAREFAARRTLPDWQAIGQRLQLIRDHDPREQVRQLKLPLYVLSGLIDPIVPWPLTFRWFRKNCPALRETKLIRNADHNVLGTAPAESAREILRWMGQQDTR